MDATKPALHKPESRRLALRRLPILLGSLKLAVVLLFVLAVAIGAATVLEADHGRAYAQWYVYHSGWFVALLSLLGVNIFCAAASRWPWKRHQTGFVITHCGLLTLLTGSIVTFVGGIEGQVTLVTGQTTTKLALPHQSQITASWADRPEEASYEFEFEPGPVDWRQGRTLDLGVVDGLAARVLRYYSHARAIEEWAADETARGGPLARLRVEGTQATAGAEQVLAHARKEVTFESVAETSQREKSEPAAKVAIDVGGTKQTIWLQRNHPSYGTRKIATPQGMLTVRFGYAELPLGFGLRLVEFRRDRNPGGVGNASFSSLVRVTGANGVGEERTISMNKPLTHQRMTFYQSGFSDATEGAESSTLSVAYDPGRALKYAGSLMICLGIAVMFYMRAYFFKREPGLLSYSFAMPAAADPMPVNQYDPETVENAAWESVDRLAIASGSEAVSAVAEENRE